MSEPASPFFTLANKMVSFDKDSVGGFYIRNWHNHASDVGAYGIESRVLTLISKEHACMTLQTQVVDSIGEMLIKSITSDESGRVFGVATISEMYEASTQVPNFSAFKSLEDIPSLYVDKVSHDIPMYLYSREQVIVDLGAPEVSQDGDVTTLSMPIRLSGATHEMEIKLKGEWVPYTLQIPEFFGELQVAIESTAFKGGKVSFDGQVITIPGVEPIKLRDEDLATLSMVGGCYFDLTQQN